LRLPDLLRTVILPKGQLGESNTWYEQGGIAASVGRDDDPNLHLQDTFAAGAGLVDIDAAMAERGPQHPMECL
jgi:L-aspartate oxidase